MGLEKEIQVSLEKALFTFEQLKDTLLFLKNDWNEESPYKPSYIQLPLNFINEYIAILKAVLKEGNYSKKAVDSLNQRLGSFTRNFDNPFFETDKSELIKSLISELIDYSRSLDRILQEYEEQS